MQPVLETERLLLRPFAAADSGAFAEIYSDPEMFRFILDGKPLDRLEAWRTLAALVGHWVLRGYGQWAMIEKSANQLVGRVGLSNPDGGWGNELVWHVRRSHWGRGYASEGAEAAIDWAFGTLNLDSVLSVIHVDNKASLRIAQKLGMTHLRDEAICNVSVPVYGLTRIATRSGR
jgi:RimJ/RimL family protein N-acetyltransferase